MTEAEREALETLAKITKTDDHIHVSITLPEWAEMAQAPILKINHMKVWNWVKSKGHDVRLNLGDDVRNNLTVALRSGEWTFPLVVTVKKEYERPVKKEYERVDTKSIVAAKETAVENRKKKKSK